MASGGWVYGRGLRLATVILSLSMAMCPAWQCARIQSSYVVYLADGTGGEWGRGGSVNRGGSVQVKQLEGAHASCEDDMAARNYTIQQLRAGARVATYVAHISVRLVIPIPIFRCVLSYVCPYICVLIYVC